MGWVRLEINVQESRKYVAVSKSLSMQHEKLTSQTKSKKNKGGETYEAVNSALPGTSLPSARATGQ